MRNISVIFSLACWLLCSQLCSGGDTLTSGQKISEDTENNLISAAKKFELGFFSLPIGSGSTKKYLGIWYHNLEPQTVVWVANRDKPVVDSTGVFQIAENGNLIVADASKKTYWSSEIEGSLSRNVTVKLMDSGNLVVMKEDGSYMWQSFQYPTDTFLPGMKMDSKLKLTCWKNNDDPGIGSFTFEQSQKGDTRNYIINNDSQLYWAPNNGYNLQGIHPTLLGMLENYTSTSSSYRLGKSEHYTFTNSSYKMNINEKSRVLMNFTGEIQFLKWDEEMKQWLKEWGRPSDICDIHNYCGAFSSCNVNNWKPCKCLPGFSQRLSDNSHAYLEGRSQGCSRKSTLCGAIANNDSMFVNLTNIKLGNPDKEFLTETEQQCQSKCLDMCLQGHSQCQAYSFNLSTYSDRSSVACWIWTRDLPTLREEQDDGRDLSIPVKRSEIGTLCLLSSYLILFKIYITYHMWLIRAHSR